MNNQVAYVKSPGSPANEFTDRYANAGDGVTGRGVIVKNDREPSIRKKEGVMMLSWLNKTMVLIGSVVGTCLAQGPPIGWPPPLPDSIPVKFLPGVVTATALDFATTFSSDGKTVFFCRGAKGAWQIYQLALRDVGRLKPELVPFSDRRYSQADPFMTNEGTLYFISNRPSHTLGAHLDYNIWRTKRLKRNRWSPPEFIKELNSDSTEYYVSVAKNGNLYFASNRPGGSGGLDLYVSQLINGQYTPPDNLGPSINTTGDEHDPLIVGQEDYLVFTSDRPEGYGEADLYFSKKTAGGWSMPQNMGGRINTATYEYCPSFSPDGRYFFFSSELTIKWLEANYLPFQRTQSP